MSEAPFRFTPCHERWEQMTPSERGRLCAKCNTEIVDFRNSTEAEIEHTIATSPVRICGYYAIAQFQKPGSRLAAAATAATIALASPTVAEAAQQSPAVTVTPDVAPADSTVIRGIVRDSASRTPLIGVQVMIPNTRIGTITDSHGRFRLATGRKFDHPITVRADYIGYYSRTIELAAGDTTDIEFALPQAVVGIVGIVVTGSTMPAEPKPSFWQYIGRFIRWW